MRQQPSHRVTSALATLAALLALAPLAPAQQVPLNPTKIPQFVEPLPPLGPSGIPVVDGKSPVTLSLCEFKVNVLPVAPTVESVSVANSPLAVATS